MNTLHHGLSLGHTSAEIAADNAGSDWIRIASEAFSNFAKSNHSFTTEQVREAFPDIPPPPDKRAWGQIARLAKSKGVVKSIGWIRANSPTVHGMVVTLWQSKILEETE